MHEFISKFSFVRYACIKPSRMTIFAKKACPYTIGDGWWGLWGGAPWCD